MTRPAPLVTLTTERLVLAAPDETDVPRLATLANDWDVASRTAAIPHPYDEDDARRFLTDVVPAQTVWAVRLPGEGLIGTVGLRAQGPGAASLGYWIGQPYWNRGYATEAARAAVAHALAHGVTRIEAGYFAENPASGRVLARLGFVETGRSVFRHELRGEDVPHVDMLLPT